jgi:hypothetical protein
MIICKKCFGDTETPVYFSVPYERSLACKVKRSENGGLEYDADDYDIDSFEPDYNRGVYQCACGSYSQEKANAKFKSGKWIELTDPKEYLGLVGINW